MAAQQVEVKYLCNIQKDAATFQRTSALMVLNCLIVYEVGQDGSYSLAQDMLSYLVVLQKEQKIS